MKHTAIFLALLVFPVVFPDALQAAAPAVTATAKPVAAPTKPADGKSLLGQHDNHAPIDISADNFQADLNAKTGTYTGNVIVVQGDTKLRSNQVRVTTVTAMPTKSMPTAMW